MAQENDIFHVDASSLDIEVIPLNGRILICRDEEDEKSPGGLILPEGSRQPKFTARVLKIAGDIENNPAYDGLGDLRELDKVIVMPQRSWPIEFNDKNRLYLIPACDIIAILKRVRNTDDEE